MKILVADDNLTYRTVLKAMLTQWGYEVLLASDGLEAWAALQGENAPRIAILDWLMPGVDGVEICRRLRSSSPAYVYTVVLTAKTHVNDFVFAIESGADDYITKPFNSQELRVRLRAGIRIIGLQQRLDQMRTLLADPMPGIPAPAPERPADNGAVTLPEVSSPDTGHSPRRKWTLPSQLTDLMAHEPTLLPRLVAEFNSETACRIRHLRTALLAHDWSTLRVQSHTIKGSALQLGALDLAGIALRIEQAAVEEIAPRAEDLDQLQAEFDQTCAEMVAALSTAGSLVAVAGSH